MMFMSGAAVVPWRCYLLSSRPREQSAQEHARHLFEEMPTLRPTRQDRSPGPAPRGLEAPPGRRGPTAACLLTPVGPHTPAPDCDSTLLRLAISIWLINPFCATYEQCPDLFFSIYSFLKLFRSCVFLFCSLYIYVWCYGNWRAEEDNASRNGLSPVVFYRLLIFKTNSSQ